MQAEKNILSLRKLGLADYTEVWELQKKLQQELIHKNSPQTLISCEHPKVITLGSKTKPENILLDQGSLENLGIKIYQTERGGDVTCHAPGQIVLYPILDLNLHKRDVNWYMRSLEQVIISTLAAYDIEGLRVEGKTGVWIMDQITNLPMKKIASIGVRISRWVTMHGLALNVKDCLDIFKHVNPCGYTDIAMTEMQELSKINLDKTQVMNSLIDNFCKTFNFQTQE